MRLHVRCHAEMRAWAARAAGFVRRVAEERAGGLAVTVRTIAHCGAAGMVAYGLLGEGAFYGVSHGPHF